MRNLLLSTTILGASLGGAVAQEAPFRTEADPTEIHASEFIGMRVYASEAAIDSDQYEGLQEGWQDLGEINDVILSRDGSVEAVLVDIGGFLGMGERQVAVDMNAIKFVSDSATADNEGDYFLVMNADRATIEGAPEYSWNAPMGAGDQAATDVTMTEGDAASTDVAATDPTTATEGDTAAAAEATAATDGDAAATDLAATDASTEGETALTGDASAETAAREPILRDGFVATASADLTSETLTGARVYDANDEWIGDVAELILTEDGQVTDAVVDVGGFLGIGAKPVALKLEDVDILRQDSGNEVRVYVSMTKEQLEQLPNYEG